MTVALHEGDMREVIPRLVAEGCVVDAVVTDAPYGIGFMNVAFDCSEGCISFKPETWRIVATILRPGGFLLAFGGTRTSHRMICAIEDAGFVIQDTIMWMYATGFPKRRDMLKPAFEPICVAYRPGGKRTLQVEECRIGTTKDVPRTASATRGSNYGFGANSDGDNFNPNIGRWPANVILEDCPEVMDAFPNAPGQLAKSRSDDAIKTNQIYGRMRHDPEPQFPRGDTGSAARFFYCAKANKIDRAGSLHPTVKPIELIRYLIKLVCPIDGTFLDCFAGSGTAGVAALAEGRNAILIEQDATYCADIRARLAHYEGEGRHSLAAKARNRQPREPEGTLL